MTHSGHITGYLACSAAVSGAALLLIQATKDYLNANSDCHLEIGYREELAHLIYAGADLPIVPSKCEPCGLAPLIAMRYGTVPVVRATGGIIDTVFGRDHSGHPPAERNGYVFSPHGQPGHRVRAQSRPAAVVRTPARVPQARG
jgi:glycogen synthase